MPQVGKTAFVVAVGALGRLLNEVTLQAQALKATGTLLPAIQYQATKKKRA